MTGFTEEQKKEAKKALAENNKLRKQLEQANREYFKVLRDPNKLPLDIQFVEDAHEDILDSVSEDLEMELLDVLKESIENTGIDDYFEKVKHLKLYKEQIKELVDKYDSHPVQRRMTRKKVFKRTQLKKCNTVNQYLNELWNIRKNYMINEEYTKFMKAREKYDVQFDIIVDVLELLSESVQGLQKQKVYELKMKGYTTKEISDELNISESTVKRYFRSVQDIIKDSV